MKFLTICMILLMLLTGCVKADKNDNTPENIENVQKNESIENIENIENVQTKQENIFLEYEAEDATLLGRATIKEANDIKFVDKLEQDGDGLEFEIEIEKEGFYDINVISKTVDGTYKENYLRIDGEDMGTVSVESITFTDSIAKRIYLNEGVHTVSIMKFWGWTQIDKLEIKSSPVISEDRFEVEPVLANPNASDNAKRLMAYLCDMYGEKIISGQYCDTGMYGKENEVIHKVTNGKYPAILGLDMMDYSPSRVAKGTNSKAVDYAIEYWEAGGIVTFCWHWNAPEKYLTGQWYSGFYKEHTNIGLAKIMNGEDKEGYDLLMEDIDAIAEQLIRLKEVDVPVLWRPLHEASGGWFWWGNAGADAYKELYKLLYDRLTNEYELNNLIWVWNGQDKEWYPGDEYVDIIGEDIYPGEKVYTPQTSKYYDVLEYTQTKKMVVLSENGCLFDPDLAVRDGAMWGYFGTWGGEFVVSSGSVNSLSEQYTEEEMVKKVYEHENVITRDELPDLSNYPVN